MAWPSRPCLAARGIRIACAICLGALFLQAIALAVEPAGGARFLPLADAAFAGSSINVVANVRQTVFTHDDTQFAGFYDADGVMVLAKRAIGSDKWETRRTGHKGTVADAHNAISLAVDGAGFLHVSWDHHGNPLNYARSVAAGTLELAEKSPMTGSREARVTYPQFFRLPEGDLLFLYRDGQSGRGALVLNRYAVATGRWTQLQPNLIDGEGARSPYWGMTVDRRGTLHLTWIWRDTPDVATNHDLGYARSADGGITWTKSDGAPLVLPITAARAEYAARIPTRSNLMNSPVIEADAAGRPFIMTYWSPTPEAPPQFQIAHRDGAAWKIARVAHPLTPFVLAGGGTKRPPISRGILLLGAGGAHVIYRDDSRGGKILAVSGAAGLAGPWQVRELTADGVGAWEPAYDPLAWERHGEAHLLVQRVEQRDGNDRSAAPAAPSALGVLTWKPRP